MRDHASITHYLPFHARSRMIMHDHGNVSIFVEQNFCDHQLDSVKSLRGLSVGTTKKCPITNANKFDTVAFNMHGNGPMDL